MEKKKDSKLVSGLKTAAVGAGMVGCALWVQFWTELADREPANVLTATQEIKAGEVLVSAPLKDSFNVKLSTSLDMSHLLPSPGAPDVIELNLPDDAPKPVYATPMPKYNGAER